MNKLLRTLKLKRRAAAESLRSNPHEQSLRWTLADLQNSISAVEAVIREIDEEQEIEDSMRDMVIL